MKTILHWSFWVLLGIALLAVISRQVKAEPIVAAESEGIRVVIYSDDCQMSDVVSNLPKRATWTDHGKEIEGCAGAFPGGIVLLYFADKTVVAVPMAMFQRVTEA